MKTMQKKHGGMTLAFITLLTVVVAVSVIGWIIMKPKPLVLQGQVEANETRVSGKVPGRIEKIFAQEGMTVKQGDTLVILSSPELQAKLMQATSSEDAANAQNLKAMKGARSEQILGALELWKKAEVGVLLAEKTFHRIDNMFNEGVISQQKRDEADAAYKAAIATSNAAKSQYDMAVNGAEKEDKLATAAMVNKAKGAVNEVQSYLSETILLAPSSGEIADIFPRQGELVGSGAPIMSIADLENEYVVFNIREDLLSGIQTGKELKAKIPALGNKDIFLKVYYIKAMASYATFKTTKTNGGFDVKTFEVRAKPTSKVDGLRPGMSLLVDYSLIH
jgi:HlyD family secretion protein